MHSSFHRLAVLLGLLPFSLPAPAAAPLNHQAPLGDAVWQFSGDHRHCQLRHPVPSYGFALFEHDNRGNETLRLHTYRPVTPLDANANLRRLLPSWRHLERDPRRIHVTLQPGLRPLELRGSEVAWVLNGLHAGYLASLDYLSADPAPTQVRVSLSPSNFRDRYAQYLGCITQLAPPHLSAAEAGFGALRFASDEHTLSDSAAADLHRLAAYLLAHPEVSSVRITGHADSSGKDAHNLPLSARRAEAAAALLKRQGVPAARIRTRHLGASAPISDNTSPAGRAANRRVELQFLYAETVPTASATPASVPTPIPHDLLPDPSGETAKATDDGFSPYRTPPKK